MRNELEPSETESWVESWAQILKKIRHAEKDAPLSLLIEAVRMVDSRKNIHEHPVVRSLVEISLLNSVVIIKNLADELENLGHELVFV